MKTFILTAVSGLALGLAPSLHAQEKPVVAGIVFQGDQFMKSLQEGMRAGAKTGGATLLETNVDGKQEREA